MLRRAIYRGPAFAGIEPGLKTAMDHELDMRITKLVIKVQAIFDMVRADFDSMFIVHERPNVNRDNLRSAIRDFVHKAETTLNGPMEEQLAKAVSESD